MLASQAPAPTFEKTHESIHKDFIGLFLMLMPCLREPPRIKEQCRQKQRHPDTTEQPCWKGGLWRVLAEISDIWKVLLVSTFTRLLIGHGDAEKLRLSL